jgi:ribosomal-protein-alanine N-acetyltransferase
VTSAPVGEVGSTRTDGVPTSFAVTISPMRRRHLRTVLDIETRVYPRPWSSRLFEEELDRSNRVYLVARVGPAVVGYAGLLMIADDGHVATVAVDPAWQGHGVASRLLAELVRGALALGANQLTLEVRVSNLVAQSIYRRFGFAPAGARKAYYSDNGEDALVMWAHGVSEPTYLERLSVIDASFSPPTVRQGFSTVAAVPSDHPAAAAGSTPSTRQLSTP